MSTNPGVLAVDEEDFCELCGELGELRPYGPQGERICFNCGMKDEGATRVGFLRFHEGDEN